MLTTTNEVKAAWLSPARKLAIKIEMDDKVYDNNTVTSLTFDSGSISGESFQIGSTYINSIKIVFPNIIESVAEGLEILPFIGIDINGNVEYTPLGKFTISEFDRDRNSQTTTVTANDEMSLLEGPYLSKLKYPARIRDVALEIANLAGVEVDKVSFSTLETAAIKQPIGYSFRQAISLIAQFEGGYATFNRDGKLSIKRLTPTEFKVTPANYLLKGFKKNEMTYRIGGIRVRTGENEKDFLTVGSAQGAQVELENSVMTQVLLNQMWDRVKRISYFPFELRWQGMPALEAGDWIYIKDKEGKEYSVPNLSFSFEFNGGMVASSSANTTTTGAANYRYRGTLSQKIEYIDSILSSNDWNSNYYDSETAPENPRIGDLWFKQNGPDTEIWIYEKVGEPDIFDWVLKISSAVNDTIKEKIEELEQTSKDISESVDKALEEAEIARKEAFNSDKLANEAKKDAYEASQKGNQNSLEISNIDNQLKVSAVKVEENTTRITNIKIENDRLSSVMLETQDSLESLKLSSDRNYILGTSDEYKNVNFSGSSTGPTDPEPPEKLVDVQVTGYDEYYNTLYTDVIKAVDGSDKTFYAKSVTGYEIVGQTSKTVKVSSYTKVVFEYKKTGSGGGTPSKKVDVKVQCFDEQGIVINSYIESHTINTYVTFVAKDINDYELTSSRTQEIYVNENSIVKFNYKKKEEKPPISTIGDNILTGSDKETEIRGAYLNPMEYILYNLAKPANQSGISLNDLVQVEFEVVSKNISQTGGYMQFAIDNSANLSDYISIDNLPNRGKYTGTFRISGSNPQNSTTRSVVARVKDFKSGNSIRIKNLTIKKMTQTRMNLQLFSNSLSGLVKIGQIDIDGRFSNEPNFLVSCYVDTDYDTGLEIILKNSYGSETKRIKSQGSKRSGFIECDVPYVQGAKTIEVYLANRSSYSYNKGRYKWLQGEIGNARTPWKLATEDLASKTKVSSLEQTVDGFQMNVNNSLDGMNGQLTVMSNQINTTVNKVETVDGKVSRQETRITQLSNQLDFKVSANEVISRINMSPERIRIDSKLIHLSGQTLIDDAIITSAMIKNVSADTIDVGTLNGSRVRVINIEAENIIGKELKGLSLTSIDKKGYFNVTGNRAVLQNTSNNRRTEINDRGMFVYNIDGTLRSQFNQFVVNTGIIGTNTYNVYVGTGGLDGLEGEAAGGELRVVRYDSTPGDGNVTDYAYRPVRAEGFIGNYINVNTPFAGAHHLYLRPRYGTGEVRVTGSGTTGTYQDLRVRGIYGNTIDKNEATAGGNIYIRPSKGAAVVFSEIGTTDKYVDFRGAIARVESISQINTNANMYIGTDGEVRITSRGMGGNAGGITYRAIRASAFLSGSLKEYKQDIKSYDNNALEIISKSEIHSYHLRSEISTGKIKQRIGLVIGQGFKTPEQVIDGDGIEQYAMVSLAWKAIQELSEKINKLEDLINE